MSGINLTEDGKSVVMHGHDLNVHDWRTCLCGRVFATTRAMQGHVTKANRRRWRAGGAA